MMPDTMAKNKLLVAAAGSGKTSRLVDDALKIDKDRVLITTYTEANEAEIRSKIVEKNKSIPGHITVQTWFSFLLQHGVRPYQGYFFGHDIKGMDLIGGQSARGISESDTERHYFNKQRKIYSDKISKFVLKCHHGSKGKIISRLSRIYQHIFIDEVQDLAGYDLEFINLLLESDAMKISLVLDPRQGTYSTNNSSKNKRFSKSNILDFFDGKEKIIEKDDTSLRINYRSISPICELSNKLYPDYPATTSGNLTTSGHDGIFLVRRNDVSHYLSRYSPVQLRHDKSTVVDNGAPAKNFGESKGLSFDRVLIYPTVPIIKWMKDSESDLAPISRSKLYVAITRPRYSVAFVYDYKDNETIDGMNNFRP